ncbi:general vesicular transport factor p115 [Chrysoperla carnea]|uniref:general vesicular transport factor p115 n=1 Tax=Chrysoperla carnea TaxID=189513 RepID=UPI001D06400B|nr:general vesicular transport factor p115 [Chrysoperla carnea]
MEYFKSGLKTVLGAQQPGDQPSGADTVERLVDRVTSSTLLEDRRDACRALKALSRKFRVEVGAQGMDALRQTLETDRADIEIVSYCLDTLCNITAPESFEDEQSNNAQLSSIKVGEQFSEMFLKNPDNVALILSFLEEYNYQVRRPAVKLLTNLLDNKTREIQQIVLESKLGVSKLMDLLADSREVIRNDALRLFIHLTKGNANIQKIVAFENAFDRLFDIIMDEGSTDGGIIVEDCLLLMLNLLKNNTSNQNFFKEGSYIHKLAPMFILPAEIEEQGWSPQKVSNMHCTLQLVRTLVTPGNPHHVVSSSQKTMKSCGLLETLCNILMASGVPADILTETINTVGDIIRGNLGNQEYFASVMAPCNPPRPSLVILLMSMVNEKQPYPLRCAVLYCFECFLYKNEIGQTQVVQTLLPSNTNTPTVTMGQLLCSGLFSAEPLSSWFSAVALSHAMVDNPAQKEQMLRVLLATNLGTQPISLLHQCATMLQEGNKLKAKVGILILLATWMANCPVAVKTFLNVPGSMAFLTAQTSANEHDVNEDLLQGLCAFLMGICVCFNDDSVHTFTIENLCQLIERRVGIETYITKLSDVSKHEMYSRAAKQPQIKSKASWDMLLDFEFCKLFKSLEGIIIKTVSRDLNRSADQNGLTEFSLSSQENGLLLQYKELIREQDKQLKELTNKVELLTSDRNQTQEKLEDAVSKNSELQDQITLLRAQLAAEASSPLSSPSHEIPITAQNNETNDANVEKLINEKKLVEDELNTLKVDLEDLLQLLTHQSSKLTQYKKRLRELGEEINDSDSDVNSNDGSDRGSP